MLILHILTRLLRAGSEENTIATCRAQTEAGHRVVLVHGRDFDPAMRAKASRVAEVIAIESMVHPISPLHDLAAIQALSHLCRDLKVDVVHTHQSKAGVLGRIAARMARTPTIIHGVHILPFINVSKLQELIFVAAERICATFTDAFISVSPSVRDACIERGIGAQERHFVAFSAMDIERFKSPAPPADWRALLNLSQTEEKPPTAVMLAAFEPRKRQLEFIRALPDAFASLPDWRVLFAGEGETLEQARALADALGLSQRVCFAGFRQDPEAMIAMADIGLLTSEREGLPRVIVQFAASGKPSVISDIPGIEDIVQNGVSAVITPHHDVAAAAWAAAALLGAPARLRALTIGARAIDVDAWAPERMTASINNAYDFARRGSRYDVNDEGD